jgi:hypothetical protein
MRPGVRLTSSEVFRAAALVSIVVCVVSPAAQEPPLPDFQAFAAKVRQHLATDEERQSGYAYVEKRTEQRLNGSGEVTSESVKLFEIYPGLPGQDRYQRLIEENGKPVPPAKLADRDRDRQKEVESYASRMASANDRQKETQRLEKARRRYAAAIDDLFRVYDIHMIRREAIDGHGTILATLTPKPGAKPQTDDGKIMQHFKARAWISEADYELVRVEIEAIDDLSMGLGLLARIHKGTTATYQRRKVNEEVWLPAEVTWTASARVLLVRRLRIRGTAEFSGYRKFTVDTSTTYSTPGL